MKSDWVLDVLADLKLFARENALPTLAEHLDDTMMVAAVELDRRRKGSTAEAAADEREARNPDFRSSAGQNP